MDAVGFEQQYRVNPILTHFHVELRATIQTNPYCYGYIIPCQGGCQILPHMTRAILTNEQARLSALRTLDILDTPPEPRFDRFTRLAAKSLQVPISLVSLVEEDRQWFKSRCGLDVQQTDRSLAFCSHAVELDGMLIVEDATLDSRFKDNELVTGNLGIRFYAGQPIYSDGQPIGTLCVIDKVARQFTQEDRECLRDIAKLVEDELIHARVEAARLLADYSLRSLNSELEQRVRNRTAELEDKVNELSKEIVRRESVEYSLRQSEDWNRTIISSSHNGFIATDRDGSITEWNKSAERILGWNRDDVLGMKLLDVIIPEHLRTHHGLLMQRALAGDSEANSRNIEVPVLTACGKQIIIEVTISSYLWDGQRCFGTFINDVSERIRTKQQLEEQKELLDAVMESIDIAVVASDALGNLTLFNRAARKIHGVDPRALAPAEWSNYYSLYNVNGKTPLEMDEIPLVRVLKGETVRDEALVVAPRGREPLTMLASGRTLRGASGQMLGAVVALKDITELNASRAKLAVSERRLRAVTENLPAMMAKVNVAGKFVFLNRHALEALRRTNDELLGQSVEVAYKPEDFAKIRPYIERVKRGESVHFEYVVNRKDDELYYQCCFIPQRSHEGKPDGFFAMAHDITARKVSQMRQAESEERLRTITDNVPVLIAQLDNSGRFTFANAVHRAWLGKEPQTILGLTMEEAFGSDYYDPQRDAISQAWAGNASQCEHEIVRNKRTRIVHSMFLPQIRNGLVNSVYVLSTDATASRLHERNLHALAHTDTLTELPNRRHFETALDAATERAPHADGYTALLYLDVDNFKQINDGLGHSMGDAVLVEFAKRLQAAVRSSDLVARLAGDEFTVLLNDVRGLIDVELVAQKILMLVREPFVLHGRVLHVTTTIGAALGERAIHTSRELIEAADSALYQAKGAGRDTYATKSLTKRGMAVGC